MTDINVVQSGLLRYIETDLAPKVTGLKGTGILFFAILYIKNLKSNLAKATGLVEMTGAVDGDKVNVPVLYESAKMLALVKPLTFDLGAGTLTIPATDVDKIYNYIMTIGG